MNSRVVNNRTANGTSLSDADQRRLMALVEVLREFEEVEPNMPVGMITAWLQVALNEGASLTELMEKTGRPQSTLSRYLLDLSGHKRRSGDPLPPLIEWNIDPEELRRKQYRLSSRGKELLKRIRDAIDRAARRAKAA